MFTGHFQAKGQHLARGTPILAIRSLIPSSDRSRRRAAPDDDRGGSPAFRTTRAEDVSAGVTRQSGRGWRTTARLPCKGRLSVWSVNYQDAFSEDVHPQKGLVVRTRKRKFEEHPASERPCKQTPAAHATPDPEVSEELVRGHDMTGALNVSLSDDGEAGANSCAGANACRTRSGVRYRIDPDGREGRRNRYLNTRLRRCDAYFQRRSCYTVIECDQHRSKGPSKAHC